MNTSWGMEYIVPLRPKQENYGTRIESTSNNLFTVGYV